MIYDTASFVCGEINSFLFLHIGIYWIKEACLFIDPSKPICNPRN